MLRYQAAGKLLLGGIALACSWVLAACDDAPPEAEKGALERAGETAGEALTQAGKSADDFIEKASDTAGEVMDKTGETLEAAGKEFEKAGKVLQKDPED